MKGYGKIKSGDGKPFVKGDPRINREGRPKKLPELDSLLAECLGEEGDGESGMRRIVEGLIRKAEKGDTRAAELLINRAYGLLTARHDISLDLHTLPEAAIDSIADKLYSKQKKNKDE